MKIGLVDVDGHNFPNLALMKIASWHRQQGDTVEWAFAFSEYDRIYKSKVFTFTPDDMTAGLQAEDFAAHRQHILTDREMYERAKEWYR